MKILRPVGFPVVLGLLAWAGLAWAPAVSATTSHCLVINASSNTSYKSLQPAQDAASAWGTLWVRGACSGTTEITKDLTITGQQPSGFTAPTLNGGGQGIVLIIDDGATVTINTLTVTGGTADFSGGDIADIGDADQQHRQRQHRQPAAAAASPPHGDADAQQHRQRQHRRRQRRRHLHQRHGDADQQHRQRQHRRRAAAAASHSDGTVTLTDSTVSGNTASGGGGGIATRRHGDADRQHRQRQHRQRDGGGILATRHADRVRWRGQCPQHA